MIRGDGLGILGEDLYPVKSVRFFNFFNNLFPLSGELIHLYDGVKTPVGDKKGIFVDNKRERMSNETRWNGLNIHTIEAGMLKKKIHIVIFMRRRKTRWEKLQDIVYYDNLSFEK